MPNLRKDSQTLSDDLFFMRGIGILLVVVVHVLGVDAVHGVRQLFAPTRMDLRVMVDLVHSFNMAVMLMGSGVAVAAFGRADLGLSEFLRKKVTKLVIPMLVWAPALFAMQEMKRGRPQGMEAWLQLLQQLPSAWFPPYSIFWFMHALIGCTLLAWLFRKFAAPRLGRWSDGVYFGLSMILFLAVSTGRAGTLGGAAGEYVETILYWNRFFGLGMLVFAWLAPARQVLARLPLTAQGLLPVGFFGLIALVYALIPEAQYEVARTINGPLGFCMLFTLAVFLRTRVSVWGALWTEAWRRMVLVGSMSMTIYLFHLYFVSGTRVALERWHPGTPLVMHVVIGTLAGCLGPWLLFLVLKGSPLFHWSIGHATRVPSKRVKQVQPSEGLAPMPSPKM
jgi:fucose 4-O-acetylase-like acetyltransferase